MAQVYGAGGWMRTGDVGFVDARGALWLRGRAKDMVKSGGENVFAAEVRPCLGRPLPVQRRRSSSREGATA